MSANQEFVGEIKQEEKDGRLTFRVRGAFNYACHAQIEQLSARGFDNVKAVIFDLRETTSIDSAAIGCMLVVQHLWNAEKPIVVINPQQPVLKVLKRMNMDQIFSIIHSS